MKFCSMAVAVDQHHGFRPLSRPQRCKLQSFTHLDFTVIDLGQTHLAHSSDQAFDIVNFHRCFSTPCLSLTTQVEDDFDRNPRIEILGGCRAFRARALVVEVAIAMASGVNPVPVSRGLGGAYFMRGRDGHDIAVAKPIDEEPLAFNNPKGFRGLMLGQPGMKRSVCVGESGFRELAAYILDHGGFSGVPPTALVKISHVFNESDVLPTSLAPYKIASLQRFVDHDFDAGELGPSSFSVASVHRIGILDLRMLNLDRHAGNILVKKHLNEISTTGSLELVPIDHGLCLPEFLEDPYFEWLHWPQASVPFSDIEGEYISNLDPFKDAELLRTEVPSLKESSVRVLILCTIFLKHTAAAGFCLADIGEMMTRQFSSGQENLSLLEELCIQSKAGMLITSGDGMPVDQTYKENDLEVTQFDMENEDDMEEGLDLPETARPHKVPRFLSVKSMSGLPDAFLSPKGEENDPLICEYESYATEDDEVENHDATINSHNMGVFNRSMSFAVQQHGIEGEGFSFGDMSEDEWVLFLEIFKKLLPEVMENARCNGSKQRLGTSCDF
ncbi:phosphatidylinositol 4-kinase gamma 8-like [Rhodamnia argentea]|uniref:1-phosphatidylinositol 4-kinase n=1 Tax=Rhodamnia argentea TaxID=178133 RepID=A0A8B8NW64_9MYRT|nr:phosphatidylinositol 4-kinase gamma 8-like [Rhodamnia argentea]XP_030526038.1 phosphatidylinositol 4-kinase gamma 8-like [Rhodamnia argentea]XP_048137656.1 phosphatidylinositol 4-kinase gamma 8-like [Rhodamnia argentea]